MGNSNESVDGTININRSKTRQRNDFVYKIRTADGDNINVATSKEASKQLKNEIENIVLKD